MRLFKIHLRTERAGILGWGIGLMLYLLMIGAMYASIRDAPGYDEIWAELPDGFREAFGGVADITSVHGYYVSQASSYLPLLLGIFLVAAATKRLAGAEETGLLDHLLTRPVSRTRHYGALAAALAMGGLLAVLGVLVGTLLGFLASGVSGMDLMRLTGAVLDLLPAGVFFLGLGLLLGASFHRRSPANAIGIAAVLGLFVMEIMANLTDWLSWLSYLTPYGYYARSDLFHGQPDVLYWLLLPVAGAGLAVLGGWWFQRKDLYA